MKSIGGSGMRLYLLLPPEQVRYWRKRRKWAGTYACAKIMRRKGIGLQTALAILARS